MVVDSDTAFLAALQLDQAAKTQPGPALGALYQERHPDRLAFLQFGIPEEAWADHNPHEVVHRITETLLTPKRAPQLRLIARPNFIAVAAMFEVVIADPDTVPGFGEGNTDLSASPTTMSGRTVQLIDTSARYPNASPPRRNRKSSNANRTLTGNFPPP